MRSGLTSESAAQGLVLGSASPTKAASSQPALSGCGSRAAKWFHDLIPTSSSCAIRTCQPVFRHASSLHGSRNPKIKIKSKEPAMQGQVLVGDAVQISFAVGAVGCFNRSMSWSRLGRIHVDGKPRMCEMTMSSVP